LARLGAWVGRVLFIANGFAAQKTQNTRTKDEMTCGQGFPDGRAARCE
jgi:hypothetical protein